MNAVHQEQYIEVGIDNEKYVVKIQDIHEIIKLQDITKIPISKNYVKGVINLRGSIVPVICLRSRFRMAEAAYTKATRIVVIHYADEMVGMIVDQVNRVVAISEIQPPLDVVGGQDGSCIIGFGKTDNGLVCLLNLEQVLRH
ncbi:chemotaxis protein CheW [Paenibacillus thalictri]|uniref:Purine-binding chemotaxis protein CheW n=1 Tax=Paenibacillus thalictri TaxID=2527873 RepID=A0A4Q9DKI9_9BACL|nr:chemotaxis protein CheW [Paenibacillus thalictri]TBL72659.1 purine-binding chemotaxis protein CheW [Paenibacillus thalictri]